MEPDDRRAPAPDDPSLASPAAVDRVAASAAAGDEPSGDLATVLADPVTRAIWASLRHAPRSLDELVRSVGLDGPEVQRALHPLVDAGLVATQTSWSSDQGTMYRWDGGALTGIRAWGRRFRRPTAPDPVDHAGSDGSALPGVPATGRTAGPRSAPSVAAWTNPAVRAALRHLDERSTEPATSDGTDRPGDPEPMTR